MADGWGRYLAEYHDANPGITEDALADARDDRGRSPYDWLVEAVPTGASTVIDLACGSGPICRTLAARHALEGPPSNGRRVVGVDQSAGELARARSASPSGLLVRARATAVPVTGARADSVVASMALMLLPLEAVLAEAGRLLRPGGTFAATVPTRSPVARAVPGAGAGAGASETRAPETRAPDAWAPDAWAPDGSAFADILDTLGQAATDYPEPLDACTLGDRFSASGLTLRHDDIGLFTRTVSHPDDAELVVRSFYAPGTERARVASAVTAFERRVRSAPVRVGYRIRRLVAVR